MKCMVYTYVFLNLFFKALSGELTCQIQDTFQLQGLYKKGDIMLGGIFEVSFKTKVPDLSFRAKPEEWTCESLDFSVFQWAQTMAFTIEEINRDQSLLPNITLGYRLYDNCMRLQVALRAATALVSDAGLNIAKNHCDGLPPVVAIVGDPLSTHSIAISRMLGLFRMPMVSFYATCSCLSNKQDHPSFFRTVPSDAFQVKAMVQIIKHYGWSWVGVVVSDDEYGQYALKNFNEEMKYIGCISFAETIPKSNIKLTVSQIVNRIKQSTSTVIVVFSSRADATSLVKEAVQQNVTGKQWIASEAWSTATALATVENFASFGGTIGIAIRKGVIPGLEKFLFKIQPDLLPDNNLGLRFWETMFGCTFQDSSRTKNASAVFQSGKACTGLENITETKTAYSDVSESRASYNVYKAVYALAHALHNLMHCERGKGPFENNTCADIKSVQPWQLLHYLKKVSFTNRLNETVAFDDNGDALAIYDIVNWQREVDGSVTTKTIGIFDAAKKSGKEIELKEENIFWNFHSGKVRNKPRVPDSVCSRSCPPGTRKANRKGEPACCFDCIPCADGEISDQYWSNYERNKCVIREVEFLSYEDAMGITLTSTALFGACLSVGVLAVFIHHRNTPVVKANNSELSFLLLVSLTLCFLCSLCFIGKPSDLTCRLRHVMFGISFVLCISCILVKTIVVLMAFKATLPGNNMMKWFGVAQQRSTVFFCTFIQSLVCTVWLMTAPPVPAKIPTFQTAKLIFECNVGSLTGFSCLLGYIGLLASICFVLAFFARNLPDNFNEARFITFSMLIFCAVWITFIPAYISSPGKYTVAVEIFAILASSFGLLVAIFSPKCYIILFKPERNTKKAMMSRTLSD
uniref:Extracellular calcium-sensing receptor-like n=1 Tax=Erpetoichthys calabaricus TaxID=27687 RepID=A0A8C4SG62_ERPCA